jgi:hypothetical protein
MLSDLRAAGKYEGRGAALRGGRRPGFDSFAAETLAIRLAVKAAARPFVAAWPPTPGPGLLNPSFIVFGHHRHDPDAWYLWAKAAVDGLTDAGICTQDKHAIGCPSGRVLQSSGEEVAYVLRNLMPKGYVDGPGVRIGLTWVTP